MCCFYKLTSTRLTQGSGSSGVHQQSDYNFMQIQSHLKSHTQNHFICKIIVHLAKVKDFPISLGFFLLAFKCNSTVGKLLNLLSSVEIVGRGNKLKSLNSWFSCLKKYTKINVKNVLGFTLWLRRHYNIRTVQNYFSLHPRETENYYN